MLKVKKQIKSISAQPTKSKRKSTGLLVGTDWDVNTCDDDWDFFARK